MPESLTTFITYDPARVLLTIGGAIIEGYAPDTFLDIEYNAEDWTLYVGIDGETALGGSSDQSATLTLRLMPGSNGNAHLQDIMAKDRFRTGDRRSPRPSTSLSLSDPATKTTYTSTSCRILKAPRQAFSTEANPLEWKLLCPELVVARGQIPPFDPEANR